MVRVYMSSGTEDEIEKGIEKWSLEFDAPARDDGKASPAHHRQVNLTRSSAGKKLKYPPNYSRNLVMKCIEMFLYQK